MAYRLPVQESTSAFKYIQDNLTAIKKEIGVLAAEAFVGDNDWATARIQLLGVVAKTLEGVKNDFKVNGWDD